MNDYSKNLAPHKSAEALLKLFGISGSDKLTEDQLKAGFGITRLSVADANLNEGYVENIQQADLQYTEVKFENSINRLSGTADNPRNIERVPAGAQFNFSLQIKVLSCDMQKELEEMILTGLKLVENDALGGSGSRGYGRVKFILSDAALQKRLDNINPFASVA
jgi:CRISPR-associated protein Csm3